MENTSFTFTQSNFYEDILNIINKLDKFIGTIINKSKKKLFSKNICIFPRNTAKRTATISPIPTHMLFYNMTPQSKKLSLIFLLWNPGESYNIFGFNAMWCKDCITSEPSSENSMQPLPASLGKLVLWEAMCHIENPTILRSPHWGGHMQALYLKNPTMHSLLASSSKVQGSHLGFTS